MMRNDINLAIVAMVADPNIQNHNSTGEYCFVLPESSNVTATIVSKPGKSWTTWRNKLELT